LFIPINVFHIFNLFRLALQYFLMIGNNPGFSSSFWLYFSSTGVPLLILLIQIIELIKVVKLNGNKINIKNN